MAARENQGLQIALIMFVILTITVSVTTFYFFRKFEEAELKEKAAKDKASEALKNQTVAQEEAQELKKILGAETRDSLKTVQDNYQEDMKTYGANFKDADKHYRYLVKYLHSELAAADSRFVDAKQREEELKAKMAAVEKDKVAENEKYKDSFEKSVSDSSSERDKFNKSLAGQKEGADKVAQQLDAQRRDYEDKIKKVSDENTTLAGVIQRQEKQIKQLTGMIHDKEIFADLPRGKINWVNQRDRMVWINLGTADGLRRQITFKVLAADETNLTDGKSKGSVEVTRLLDRHLAEARIVDDDLSDPLMAGDQLFSKIWAPGRVEHFALAGFMDINGDHESDRKLIRSLILNSGGVIDAEVGDDGKKIGEVSLNTRYLILGQRPTDKNVGEFLKSYTEITAEAKNLGVETISIEKFLDNIGYKPGEQTVPMDTTAQSGDFRPKPLDNGVRQSRPPFKPRPQPSTKTAAPSAY